MNEKSIPLQRNNEQLEPAPQTGEQFNARLLEQIFTETDAERIGITFDLPAGNEEKSSQPVPAHLSFNSKHVYPITDHDKPGPSNRLAIFGSVTYHDGTAAMASVEFDVSDAPLTDGLVITPIGVPRQLYS